MASTLKTKQIKARAVRERLSRTTEISKQRELADTIMSVVSAAQMLKQASVSAFLDSDIDPASSDGARSFTAYLTRQITDVFRERLGVELLPTTGEDENDD